MTITTIGGLTLQGTTSSVMQTLAKLTILEQGINFDDENIDLIMHHTKQLADTDYEFAPTNFGKDEGLIALVSDTATISLRHHSDNNWFVLATECGNFEGAISFLEFNVKGGQ